MAAPIIAAATARTLAATATRGASAVERRNLSRLARARREEAPEEDAANDTSLRLPRNVSPAEAGKGAESAVEQGGQLLTGRGITITWFLMGLTAFHASYLILLIYTLGWLARKVFRKSVIPPIGGGLIPGKVKAIPGGAQVGMAAKVTESIALGVCLMLALALDLLIFVVIYALANPLDTLSAIFL